MPNKKQRGYRTSDEIHFSLRMDALKHGETINEALDRILRGYLGMEGDSAKSSFKKNEPTHRPASPGAAVKPEPEPEPETKEPESRVLPAHLLAKKHGHLHEIWDNGVSVVHPFGEDLRYMSAHWEIYVPGDDAIVAESHDLDEAVRMALRYWEECGFRSESEMRNHIVAIPLVVGREAEYIWPDQLQR